MIYVEDKRLILPDGRTLAYADIGNTSSSTVVLLLHGEFGVGDASRPSPVLVKKNVHLIAPSLPGWGNSSPVPNPSAFAQTLVSDITALITHLHPKSSNLKLYICGHSFGTISAQILYGSSYDLFPLGRRIAAVLLLAPYSPPHCHGEYAKCMSWRDYFMTGPLTRYAPFNLFARLAKLTLAYKFREEESVEVFVRKKMADSMGDAVRERFARWREEQGVEEGQFERETARDAARSVSRTWQGFLDMPRIYHSGWGGLCPAELDDEHSSRPVFIVTTTGDEGMSLWLAENYQLATLKVFDGGPMSAILHLNEMWEGILTN